MSTQEYEDYMLSLEGKFHATIVLVYGTETGGNPKINASIPVQDNVRNAGIYWIWGVEGCNLRFRVPKRRNVCIKPS